MAWEGFEGFVNWQQLVDNTPRLYSSQMQFHFLFLKALKIVLSWKYQVKAWTALQTWLQPQCVRHINAASTRACPVVWRMRMSHRLWALNFGAALLWLTLLWLADVWVIQRNGARSALWTAPWFQCNFWKIFALAMIQRSWDVPGKQWPASSKEILEISRRSPLSWHHASKAIAFVCQCWSRFKHRLFGAGENLHHEDDIHI